MPRVHTTSVAPLPSFVASAGGALSLEQQTVPGLAAQKYGLTKGLTTAQATAAKAGFLSSLPYSASVTGTLPEPIASAVGVFAAHSSTISSAHPGCSDNAPGGASRVTVYAADGTYRLAVSKPQRTGFRAGGAWQLPSTGAAPTNVAVLDTNCSFDGPSAIAVTYPGEIDFFAYDGANFTPAPDNGQLVRTVTWTPDTGSIAASAHVNADSSYLPVIAPDPGEGGSPDAGNVTMLAATIAGDGSLVLHHLELTSLEPGGGGSFVSDTSIDVAMLDSGDATATLAYDQHGQGTVADASYALAVRSGGVNTVWFGILGHGNNAGNFPVPQDGACAGSALPQLSVATAPGNQNDPFTGVVCTIAAGANTNVQRWSDYSTNGDDPSPPRFPSALNPRSDATLPALTSTHPFATWPCVLLTVWGMEHSDPSCSSDLAAVVVGTPSSGAARIYQLAALDGPAGTANRVLAGAPAQSAVTVDALPLSRTELTVRNTTDKAALRHTDPVPLVYLMPAPMVDGLDQPHSGAPVAFGTSAGTGTGGSTSFTTSIGATLSATLGDPVFGSLDLTASAETITGTAHGSETSVTSSQTLNDNGNEPFVVYVVSPVWQWKGKVIADSTGVGTTNHAAVFTRIAINKQNVHAQLYANSVSVLGATHAEFTADGAYGPTLMSVFGPGVFDGSGRTVAGADPGSYPTFNSAGNTIPQQDGAAFCDTHSGQQGVTSINSGVMSAYTAPDVTTGGPSYLTPAQGYRTVTVGDSGSDSQQVVVASDTTTSYSTDFSVNASVGASAFGLGLTTDVGFTIGNQTTLSASSNQSFAAEIGHITGATGADLPSTTIAAINQALRQSETYSWEPFICHRTTVLPGNGQTSALVLGFATDGFTGVPDIAATDKPTPITGATTAGAAPVVPAGSALSFTRHGPAATYQVVVTNTATNAKRTLMLPVLTPAQSAQSPATQSVNLPAGLAAGTYKWQPTAVSYNGDKSTGTARFIKLS